MGSLELFKTLQSDLGYHVEFSSPGSLTAIPNREQYGYALGMVQSARAAGRDVELLTVREARAIEPFASPDLPGYVYSRQRGNANPAGPTRAFAEAARQAGASVLTGHQVTAIDALADGSYRLATPRGEFPRGRWSSLPGRGRRPGRVAWLEHTGCTRARPDVGHRAAAAPRVPGHILHGIAALLEGARRGHYAPRSDPPRRRAADQAPIRAADPEQSGEIALRWRQAARGLRRHARRAGHRGEQDARGRGAAPAQRFADCAATWAWLQAFTLDGEPLMIERSPCAKIVHSRAASPPPASGAAHWPGKLRR